jgi:hypothetical protein
MFAKYKVYDNIRKLAHTEIALYAKKVAKSMRMQRLVSYIVSIW